MRLFVSTEGMARNFEAVVSFFFLILTLYEIFSRARVFDNRIISVILGAGLAAASTYLLRFSGVGFAIWFGLLIISIMIDRRKAASVTPANH